MEIHSGSNVLAFPEMAQTDARDNTEISWERRNNVRMGCASAEQAIAIIIVTLKQEVDAFDIGYSFVATTTGWNRVFSFKSIWKGCWRTWICSTNSQVVTSFTANARELAVGEIVRTGTPSFRAWRAYLFCGKGLVFDRTGALAHIGEYLVW